MSTSSASVPAFCPYLLISIDDDGQKNRRPSGTVKQSVQESSRKTKKKIGRFKSNPNGIYIDKEAFVYIYKVSISWIVGRRRRRKKKGYSVERISRP